MSGYTQRLQAINHRIKFHADQFSAFNTAAAAAGAASTVGPSLFFQSSNDPIGPQHIDQLLQAIHLSEQALSLFYRRCVSSLKQQAYIPTETFANFFDAVDCFVTEITSQIEEVSIQGNIFDVYSIHESQQDENHHCSGSSSLSSSSSSSLSASATPTPAASAAAATSVSVSELALVSPSPSPYSSSSVAPLPLITTTRSIPKSPAATASSSLPFDSSSSFDLNSMDDSESIESYSPRVSSPRSPPSSSVEQESSSLLRHASRPKNQKQNSKYDGKNDNNDDNDKNDKNDDEDDKDHDDDDKNNAHKNGNNSKDGHNDDENRNIITNRRSLRRIIHFTPTSPADDSPPKWMRLKSSAPRAATSSSHSSSSSTSSSSSASSSSASFSNTSSSRASFSFNSSSPSISSSSSSSLSSTSSSASSSSSNSASSSFASPSFASSSSSSSSNASVFNDVARKFIEELSSSTDFDSIESHFHLQHRMSYSTLMDCIQAIFRKANESPFHAFLTVLETFLDSQRKKNGVSLSTFRTKPTLVLLSTEHKRLKQIFSAALKRVYGAKSKSTGDLPIVCFAIVLYLYLHAHCVYGFNCSCGRFVEDLFKIRIHFKSKQSAREKLATVFFNALQTNDSQEFRQVLESRLDSPCYLCNNCFVRKQAALSSSASSSSSASRSGEKKRTASSQSGEKKRKIDNDDSHKQHQESSSKKKQRIARRTTTEYQSVTDAMTLVDRAVDDVMRTAATTTQSR